MAAVNQDCVDLVKRFEGKFLESYLCPAGVPTIGYGHTGKNIKLGMKISNEEAESLLEEDLAVFATGVKKLVHVSINENQLGALVSFSFNLGLGSLGSSTLLKKLNAGDYTGAADEFLRWNHCKGMVLAGLTRRREAERLLFLKEVD